MPKTKPTVFIGMRTHNSKATIDGSLKSIYAQTYPNIKVVFYDDKSTDNTLSYLKIWKKKFASRGIACEIIESAAPTNEGCGKASEHIGKAVAARIADDDIYMGLDSDDTFTGSDVVKNVVAQMEKQKANVCIAGYTIQGDASLVINDKGGLPHNELSHKLSAESGAVTVSEMPEIASTADSIGWSKITRGNIFKRYMKMYPNLPKEMNVCEDFPTLAIVLYKDARITGMPENIYNYFKHAQSSTAQIVQKEAFSVVRIGFLQVLQDMVKNHREAFIDDAEKYVNAFIEKKYAVIGNIVDKKATEGYLTGYNRQDFERDFKTKIDCRNLNLSRFLSPSPLPNGKGGNSI